MDVSCGCAFAKTVPVQRASAEAERPQAHALQRMETDMADASFTREQLIDKLNEDLAREYQAIIAYVVYSQVLKGAQFMSIAKELESHAAQELGHAITIAKHI